MATTAERIPHDRLLQTAGFARRAAVAWPAFLAECEPTVLRAGGGAPGSRGGHSDPTPSAAARASKGIDRRRRAERAVVELHDALLPMWEIATDRVAPESADQRPTHVLERCAIMAATIAREWPTIWGHAHLGDRTAADIATMWRGPVTVLSIEVLHEIIEDPPKCPGLEGDTGECGRTQRADGLCRSCYDRERYRERKEAEAQRRSRLRPADRVAGRAL